MSKRLKKARKNITSTKHYSIDEAISFLTGSYSSLYKAKFNETIEFIMRLTVDLKKSGHLVRGVCNLPHGLNKEIKVMLLVENNKLEEAKKSRADIIGGDDLIGKIKDGFTDFKVLVTTPVMLPKVIPIAKILGPRGLMPNPKLGTVTNDIVNRVKDIKDHQVGFKADKSCIIHAGIAKINFTPDQIRNNLLTFCRSVLSTKPTTIKSTYVEKIFLTCTHGPTMRLDLKSCMI